MLNFIGRSEKAGTGVGNMIVTCRNNGFPDPDFNEIVQPETIVVTIPLTIDQQHRD